MVGTYSSGKMLWAKVCNMQVLPTVGSPTTVSFSVRAMAWTRSAIDWRLKLVPFFFVNWEKHTGTDVSAIYRRRLMSVRASWWSDLWRCTLDSLAVLDFFFFVVVVAVVVAVERSCFVFKLAPILELTTIRNPPRVQPMEPDRRLFNQTWVSWFELIVVYSKQMTCDRYATEPDDNLLTGWFEQVFFEKKDESVGWKRSDPPITEFYRVLLGFTEFY